MTGVVVTVVVRVFGARQGRRDVEHRVRTAAKLRGDQERNQTQNNSQVQREP